MSVLARHDMALEALKQRGRYRALQPQTGHDFSSNDYLGLANSALLRNAAQDALARGVPAGAGGSRLLRGNADEHLALEVEAAKFFGVDAALFMGGGFQANTAIFSALPRHGDLVLYDALIHASVYEGLRLGRAESYEFAHNDVDAARDKALAWRLSGHQGQIWIAVEGLYSMDGDFVPVREMKALADELHAVLVVDEAHATGLYGNCGRGVAHGFAAAHNVLTLHTCGKGLGVSGALICGAQQHIDMLINRGRAFIYATAPSPLNAALVRAALSDLKADPARREAALAQIALAHELAKEHCGLSGFHSQIMPVLVGDDRAAIALADQMQRRGYDIRAIRPPTVPRGTARLRLSITLNVAADVLAEMFCDLGGLQKEYLT